MSCDIQDDDGLPSDSSKRRRTVFDNSDEEAEAEAVPKSKKRKISKSVSSDLDDDEDNGEFLPDHDDNSENQVEGASASKRAKTTSSPNSKGKSSARGETRSGKPRQRSKPSVILEKQAIPKTYAESSPVDRMIVDKRDAGSEWQEITRLYTEMTGVKVKSHSSLPNRYSRLKSNFAMMNDEDAIFLFQAKLEIEKRFEEELWERIAVKVKELGGTLYTSDALRRNYKRLMEVGNPLALQVREDAGEEVMDGE